MPKETIIHGYDKENKKFKKARVDSSGFLLTDAKPYNVILFDPNDSQPNYIGMNENKDALETDTDWVIYKFTYSGSNITKIEKAIGAWSNRTSLFS